jgi:hypothetical protein
VPTLGFGGIGPKKRKASPAGRLFLKHPKKINPVKRFYQTWQFLPLDESKNDDMQ